MSEISTWIDFTESNAIQARSEYAFGDVVHDGSNYLCCIVGNSNVDCRYKIRSV